MRLFMRIILALMSLFLIIALILALNGIEEVSFSDGYYKFLYSVSKDYDTWKLEIPQIPMIATLSTSKWYDFILNAFINFVNGFFTFLNVVIMIFNYVIQLIQFLVTFIGALFYRLPEFIRSSTPIL